MSSGRACGATIRRSLVVWRSSARRGRATMRNESRGAVSTGALATRCSALSLRCRWCGHSQPNSLTRITLSTIQKARASHRCFESMATRSTTSAGQGSWSMWAWAPAKLVCYPLCAAIWINSMSAAQSTELCRRGSPRTRRFLRPSTTSLPISGHLRGARTRAPSSIVGITSALPSYCSTHV